jgi:hypothetical protein
VMITSTTPGAIIYCTSAAGVVPPDPTATSTVCTGGVPAPSGTTTNVKAIAVAPNYAPSAIATASYSVQ